MLAVGRHALTAVIEARLRDRCGVQLGDRDTISPAIVIGVSGGSDSVALLLACAALRDRTRLGEPLIRPVAVHVHHHLRDSADDDAHFVASLCEALNVPCTIAHVHPGELRGNIMANARRLRYAELANVSSEIGSKFVTVAHHADDQLETMLMALCRGSGLARLRGLRWRRSLASPRHVNCGERWLVRPLLASTHAECEDLCRVAGIAWRDDPTNEDTSTARGRLRREVLPALRSMWPRCNEHSTLVAGQLAVAQELIDRELEAVFGPPHQRCWPRAALRDVPIDLIAIGLHRALIRIESATGAQREPRVARSLANAARAIASSDTRPRCFELGPAALLHITAGEVRVVDAAHPIRNEESSST